MRSPATQAIQNEVKRANSAAASAGITWSGRVTALSWVSDAARTPRPPATTLESSVFTIDRRFGESPASIAATSFSDAARVANPNRLQR